MSHNHLILTLAALATVACSAQTPEERIVRLVEQGSLGEAKAEVAKSDATGVELARLKGLIFHAEYKADSAYHYLSIVHKSGDTSARYEVRYAETLIWMKKTGAAYDVLNALRLDPSNALTLGLLEHKAQLLSWMGKYKDAETIYGSIVNNARIIPAVKLRNRTRRAEVYSWDKDFPRALSELDAILAIQPGDEEASLVKDQVQE
jgi:hypothetical protein